jgi:hypothetical protein
MTQNNIFFVAIRSLLRPLVRILLQNGMPYGAFLDLLKPVYVEMAAAEIESSGKKVTHSRISTVTGIPRKEVARVKELGEYEDLWAFERYNRAARVVTGWVRDQRFLDRQGQPVTLAYSGNRPCFIDLVAAFSGDVPARTILEELLEAEVVRKMDNGEIQLLKRVYIPSSIRTEKLGILGRDVAGLISTIGHNIYQEDESPLFQRKVFYDNIPQEHIPKIKSFIEQNAQKLLEEIDHEMSAHDRDINPGIDGTSRKAAGIGVYYFEEDVPEESM